MPLRKKNYAKPILIKQASLKNLTSEWQCSADTHSHNRGHGHSEHGQGHGYGHCK